MQVFKMQSVTQTVQSSDTNCLPLTTCQEELQQNVTELCLQHPAASVLPFNMLDGAHRDSHRFGYLLYCDLVRVLLVVALCMAGTVWLLSHGMFPKLSKLLRAGSV